MKSTKISVVTLTLALLVNFDSVNPIQTDGDQNGDIIGPFPNTFMANLTRQRGYPMERHETMSEDGYILTMYLMAQKAGKRWTSKTIFLNHGLFASSDCWFVNHRSASLPFKLYDEGYNVMMGNYRGTTHSKGHLSWARNSSEFWDFSWHEIGKFDLAAMIDYTRMVMRQNKIFLLGYSMGSTTSFVLLTERPEYNDKIHRFISLSPCTFQFHSKSLFKRWLAPFLSTQSVRRAFLSRVTPKGIFPQDFLRIEEWWNQCAKAIVGKHAGNLTSTDRRRRSRCKTRLSQFGIQEHKLGQESFELLLSTPIEVTSLKTLLHFFQTMIGKHFRQYDYGDVRNARQYGGSRHPPDYDLSKVTCPTSLFWGVGDEYTSKEDVNTLVEKLSGVGDLEVHEIEKKPWNHFDYNESKDAAIFLNPHILKSLQKNLRNTA